MTILSVVMKVLNNCCMILLVLKLCKPQYLEMNEKPSHDIWVPCTAQSYTQTYYDEEDTVWLKVEYSSPP